MDSALKAMKRESEHLYRWPGGFWLSKPWNDETGRIPPPGRQSFGTKTIHALLDRGLVSVTARLNRGDPCEVKLV